MPEAHPATPMPRPAPLPVSPEAHEAVDRLIAMATEKRADRPLVADSGLAKTDSRPAKAGKAILLPPERGAPPLSASQTAARVFSMLRPILPALASALRMVDHGAVQAAARLLPLLAGIPTQGSAQAPAEDTAPAVAAIEAGQQELRKEVDAVALEVARLQGQLTQIGWQNAQLDSEQIAVAERLRDLTKRVKVLTYTVILMVPMMVALVVLLVVHLRS